MKLTAKVIVPVLTFDLANPEQTIGAMTRTVEALVVRRISAGRDASGAAMPAPKDAGTDANPHGRPLNRTGSLLASIGSVVRDPRRAGGLPVGVVRPFGDRPVEEHGKIARAKVSAAARSRELRAEAKAQGKATRGVRVRTVVNQASLAAILSQPPRDARARAGNRAEYRALEASDSERDAAQDVARRTMRPRLVQTGTKEIT